MQKRHPTTRTEVLKILSKQLPFLRERYGVAKLALYGSYAKGKPRRTSDVDLLVKLNRPLGLEFVALADDLEKALGKKVDLTTFDSVERSLTHPRYGPIAADVKRTLLDVE